MALTATVHHVDLTRGTVEVTTLPEDVYRKYPGGSALAAYLVAQKMKPGTDPLGRDNVLVMAVSPLTGLPISGREPVVAWSFEPADGLLMCTASASLRAARSSALCSTFVFAVAVRTASSSLALSFVKF